MAYIDPTYQSPRSRASRGTPCGLRSTSVATSTHRSRLTHRRADENQRLSRASHFMAFMAFLAKVPFTSAFTVFIAFIAGGAAFMAFLAKVPFASAFTAFIAFIAFLAKPFASAFTAFIAFIAFIAGGAAFIAFAMARREVLEDTGTTQSTGLHRLHRRRRRLHRFRHGSKRGFGGHWNHAIYWSLE